MDLLTIKNLKGGVQGQEILKGISLSVKRGQIHALMGPNGSGKSTLASIIMGQPDFRVTGGTVKFLGKNILKLPVEQRARLGLFLSFQYPAEVAGVPLESFLRTAYNNIYPKAKLAPVEWHRSYQKAAEQLKFRQDLVGRALNEGFSGGEKKKGEILQLTMLQPKMAILDETDSGLDIDALKIVAQGVSRLAKHGMSVLIITHYSRILKYIKPDYVHVMVDGRIVRSGKKELAAAIERRGFYWLKKIEK